MDNKPILPAPEGARSANLPRVLVATTAMLTFISFWRAAAIVLNDLASSAYYAGGEAERYIGKTAPWFILAIMLFSYAVRAIYVESCSMFVRGGVYRVVKEALGGSLAKFSVSALMFDYILTGPISGVAAGQYLAGLAERHGRILSSCSVHVPVDMTAAFIRRRGYALFLVAERQRHSRIERQSAEDYEGDDRDGRPADQLVHLHGDRARLAFAADAQAIQHARRPERAGLASRHVVLAAQHHYCVCRTGTFRAGHERRRIARAGLSRNRKSEAAQL